MPSAMSYLHALHVSASLSFALYPDAGFTVFASSALTVSREACMHQASCTSYCMYSDLENKWIATRAGFAWESRVCTLVAAL
eukprot:2273692-Amphidinium_carterae.1